MRKKLATSLFLLMLVTSTFASEKITILCTTTHLSSIVQALMQTHANVTTIIPYGMCPGHFDISPNEMKTLSQADLILYHGYERFIEDCKSEDRADSHYVEVIISGNWMIPQNNKKAAQKLAEILSASAPDLQSIVAQNLDIYLSRLTKLEESIHDQISVLNQVPVLCAAMNEDLVNWLGAKVVATFPRDEDISLNAMRNIMVQTQNTGIELVLDNLQSSGKVGRTFSDELNVPFVMLSNFPQNNNYIKTLEELCTKIVMALEKGKNE